MSVEAFTWALTVPIGGNAKVVLLGLANHAHPDGSEAYPALDKLAEYAHCDRSTARRNVRKLVAEGWAVEDGLGPRGQMKYRLPVGGGKVQPVASVPARGGKTASGGVAAAPPEPSLEPSTTVQRTATRERDDWPEGLGSDTSTPDAVLAVLEEVGRNHASKVITKRSLGHTMLSAPGRDYLGEAHRMASWAAAKQGRVRDVVATYRNWLRNADESYAPAVAASGPRSSQLALVGGGRRVSPEEARQARQASRMAAARAEGLVQ